MRFYRRVGSSAAALYPFLANLAGFKFCSFAEDPVPYMRLPSGQTESEEYKTIMRRATKKAREYLKFFVARNNVAGISVAIMIEDNEPFVLNEGYKSFETLERWEDNTSMDIGDITHAMTGFMLLSQPQFYNDPEISMPEFCHPLRHRRQGVAGSEKVVTLKELLLHQSGLRDDGNNVNFEGSTIVDAAKNYVLNYPTHILLGYRYNLAKVNYWLASAMYEKRGLNFNNDLEEAISKTFEVGMKLQEEDVSDVLAASIYNHADKKLVQVRDENFSPARFASGQVFSNSSEVAKLGYYFIKAVTGGNPCAQRDQNPVSKMFSTQVDCQNKQIAPEGRLRLGYYPVVAFNKVPRLNPYGTVDVQGDQYFIHNSHLNEGSALLLIKGVDPTSGYKNVEKKISIGILCNTSRIKLYELGDRFSHIFEEALRYWKDTSRPGVQRTVN